MFAFEQGFRGFEFVGLADEVLVAQHGEDDYYDGYYNTGQKAFVLEKECFRAGKRSFYIQRILSVLLFCHFIYRFYYYFPLWLISVSKSNLFICINEI